jgi:hypothetical protein
MLHIRKPMHAIVVANAAQSCADIDTGAGNRYCKLLLLSRMTAEADTSNKG